MRWLILEKHNFFPTKNSLSFVEDTFFKVFNTAFLKGNRLIFAKGMGHSCIGVGYILDEVRDGANFADISLLVL